MYIRWKGNAANVEQSSFSIYSDGNKQHTFVKGKAVEVEEKFGGTLLARGDFEAASGPDPKEPEQKKDEPKGPETKPVHAAGTGEPKK